jgi:hypothetical protein
MTDVDEVCEDAPQFWRLSGIPLACGVPFARVWTVASRRNTTGRPWYVIFTRSVGHEQLLLSTSAIAMGGFRG